MNRTNRDALVTRYELLASLIPKLEKKLKGFPSGCLKICKAGNRTDYYLANSENLKIGKYLNRKEYKLIEDLAQKSYLKKVLKASIREAEVLKNTLDKYPNTLAEDVYDQLSDERKKLVTPIVAPIEQFVKEWQERPYVPKKIGEDVPVYETLRGERVRSKSEQIIADRLYLAGVPYKYECPLKVGNKIYHPDFTILRRSDRKEIYLEHCGKLDDPKYTKDNLPRINEYILNGFGLGDKLFLSFESSTVPLDVRVIDKMIEEYFR